MELGDIEISYGEEYLREFFISDIEQQVGFCTEICAEKSFNDENGHIVCEDNVTDQPKLPTKTKKPKRRASLTEFRDSTTTKRKNECAKRELNSIVNQLGKIDCQLNTNGDRSRVDIHFYAKFTSFKSNRECTFKYPHEDAGLTDAQAVLPRNGCMENSCAFGNKERNIWINCSYSSHDGQGCLYRVHAPCIGFPKLEEDNIKLLDGWCCPQHTEVMMNQN